MNSKTPPPEHELPQEVKNLIALHSLQCKYDHRWPASWRVGYKIDGLDANSYSHLFVEEIDELSRGFPADLAGALAMMEYYNQYGEFK